MSDETDPRLPLMHCQLGLITSFVIRSILAEIMMLVYNIVGMYVLRTAYECLCRTLDIAIKAETCLRIVKYCILLCSCH